MIGILDPDYFIDPPINNKLSLKNDFLIHLPKDLIIKIFSELDIASIKALTGVSKRLRRLRRDPLVSETIMRQFIEQKPKSSNVGRDYEGLWLQNNHLLSQSQEGLHIHDLHSHKIWRLTDEGHWSVYFKNKSIILKDNVNLVFKNVNSYNFFSTSVLPKTSRGVSSAFDDEGGLIAVVVTNGEDKITIFDDKGYLKKKINHQKTCDSCSSMMKFQRTFPTSKLSLTSDISRETTGFISFLPAKIRLQIFSKMNYEELCTMRLVDKNSFRHISTLFDCRLIVPPQISSDDLLRSYSVSEGSFVTLKIPDTLEITHIESSVRWVAVVAAKKFASRKEKVFQKITLLNPLSLEVESSIQLSDTKRVNSIKMTKDWLIVTQNYPCDNRSYQFHIIDLKNPPSISYPYFDNFNTNIETICVDGNFVAYTRHSPIQVIIQNVFTRSIIFESGYWDQHVSNLLFKSGHYLFSRHSKGLVNRWDIRDYYKHEPRLMQKANANVPAASFCEVM